MKKVRPMDNTSNHIMQKTRHNKKPTTKKGHLYVIESIGMFQEVTSSAVNTTTYMHVSSRVTFTCKISVKGKKRSCADR